MAKNSKKKRNANELAYFKRYTNENRYAKNRIKDLKDHIKKFPNDEQAIKALEGITKSGNVVPYRRNSSGQGHLTRHDSDKFKLVKYVHRKKYPEQKKITKVPAYEYTVKGWREQLAEIQQYL